MTPTFTKKHGYNTFNTPRVIAQSPYLLDPDTKFNAEGDLKVNFTVEDNDYWRAVIEQCESDLKDHAADVQKDTGKKTRLSADRPWAKNDDGTITFKTKRKSQITRKKDRKVIEVTVPQFDAKCQLIMPMVEIGGGSAINLNLEIYTWDVINRAGVSLRPLAVQVLDLYEQRGPRRGADAYGFGVVEGPSLLKPF